MATLDQAQRDLEAAQIKSALSKLMQNDIELERMRGARGSEWPADVVLTSLEAAFLFKMLKSSFK